MGWQDQSDAVVRLFRRMGAFHSWIKRRGEIQIRNPTQQGERLIKADPYALMCELRPATASKLADISTFQWGDQPWVEERKRKNFASSPLSIYEVHLGSWKNRGLNFPITAKLRMNWQPIAWKWASIMSNFCPSKNILSMNRGDIRCQGFMLPQAVLEPRRILSALSTTCMKTASGSSSIGCPAIFRQMIFPWPFRRLCLYEHADPRQGYHPHWHTHIFNFGRHEVSNFFIANALFWFEEMHIDGLRVDAVASMLYLDYGREDGEWIPNEYGGKENLHAIEFIKHFNSIVHHTLSREF